MAEGESVPVCSEGWGGSITKLWLQLRGGSWSTSLASQPQLRRAASWLPAVRAAGSGSAAGSVCLCQAGAWAPFLGTEIETCQYPHTDNQFQGGEVVWHFELVTSIIWFSFASCKGKALDH